MAVTLIGTQHDDPLLEERIGDALEQGDFDTVFVEGVGTETAETVREYTDRWVDNLHEQLGIQPDVEIPDGRLDETEIVDREFEGEVYYLDSGKTAFQNLKDNVGNSLKDAQRGELIAKPELLVAENVEREEFESVLKLYTPDPDLPYEVMSGELTGEEYRDKLEDALVDLYDDLVGSVDEEVRWTIAENVEQVAPDQERYLEFLIDRVYEREHENEREEEWVRTLEENYRGEDTAVFVGFSHLDDDRDTFYSKLNNRGYNAERKLLKGLEPLD